jgi:hypothetical protein
MWVRNGNDCTRARTPSVSFADAALDNMQIGSNRSDFSTPPPALIAPNVNFAKCIIGI